MTDLRQIIVAYEDQRGPVTGFGLHRLVVSCVADRGIAPRLDIERALADYRPLKGDSKLLRACRDDAADITRTGNLLVAVFDADRVRELLKLPHVSSEQQVRAAILQGSTAPGSVYPALLQRNVETLLRDIARCDSSLSLERVQQAIAKRLNARDLVFRDCAREVNRHARECVLTANPSLRHIIDLLCGLLISGQPP